MIENYMTKPLPGEKFQNFRKIVMDQKHEAETNQQEESLANRSVLEEK
jgi:hypothetical protein